MTVRTIVGHYKLGLTPEEIADEMGISLAGMLTQPDDVQLAFATERSRTIFTFNTRYFV